jgi:hypothetical protein
MANNRVVGVKKSQFTADTSVDDEATHDFVLNGENIKIKHSDLVNTLGVTGSIGQVGDPTGVPVLDQQGSFNAIRNLEEGFGIDLQVSPQNGITISTDFSFDETGVTLVDDPQASAALFRSLIPGEGIAIDEVPGQITIKFAEGFIPSLNTVVINQESDFPVQDETTITLSDNTTYIISAIRVTTAKRFVVGKNVAVISQNPGTTNGILEYTGTGDMFTGVDVQFFHMDQVVLQAENAQLFNFSDTVRQSGFNIRLVGIGPNPGVVGAEKFGTFDGLQAVLIDFSNAALVGNLGVNDGITLIGSIGLISISRLALVSFSPTYIGIDFGAAVIDTAFEIENFVNIGLGVGSIGFSGLTNSGNVGSGILATFNGCEFIGPVTPLVGLDPTDVQIEFDNCAPVEDSTKVIDIFLNVDETVVISAIALPDGTNFVPINGANWVTSNESRFSADSAGIITYNGLADVSVKITAGASIEKVGGGADEIATRISINGALPPLSSEGKTQQTDPSQVFSSGLVTISPGDTIQLYAGNLSGTANIIISAGCNIIVNTGD